MTALFRTQRRAAEHFDALLEEGASGDLDDRTAELLEVVGALRSVPAAQPRPEFVADLRARLMVAAETELVAAPARRRDDVARLTVRPVRTRGQRRVGLAVGAVAIIGATTSMAVASQSAIPGDALYPLKRAIENTQAGFSVGDDAKGETILDNAAGRLDEVEQLSREKDPDATLITQTLNTFSDQVDEAGTHLLNDYEEHGNEASIQELQQSTSSSIQTLSDLDAAIPPAAHDALVHAAQVVVSLDAAANQLCPTCGEPITELPPQLVAGAATALDEVTDALAGGVLPGTAGSSEGAGGQDGDQGKPSTLNPPETPITIPSSIPTTGPTTTPSDSNPIDDVLPGGTHNGTGTVGGGNGGGGGHGGKGGKSRPVDVTPVTDTVNEVVTGVVEGLNDVIGGLTGGLTGGTGP